MTVAQARLIATTLCRASFELEVIARREAEEDLNSPEVKAFYKKRADDAAEAYEVFHKLYFDAAFELAGVENLSYSEVALFEHN